MTIMGYVCRIIVTHKHTHTHMNTYEYIHSKVGDCSRGWPKGQFKEEFNRFEFSFPSPRLVAIPLLKSPVCIYPTTSLWAGCDSRSIFKQSLTGLNWEFSFS